MKPLLHWKKNTSHKKELSPICVTKSLGWIGITFRARFFSGLHQLKNDINNFFRLVEDKQHINSFYLQITPASGRHFNQYFRDDDLPLAHTGDNFAELKGGFKQGVVALEFAPPETNLSLVVV